eukprot:369525-Pyramimonas_sp.AAC.1
MIRAPCSLDGHELEPLVLWTVTIRVPCSLDGHDSSPSDGRSRFKPLVLSLARHRAHLTPAPVPPSDSGAANAAGPVGVRVHTQLLPRVPQRLAAARLPRGR